MPSGLRVTERCVTRQRVREGIIPSGEISGIGGQSPKRTSHAFTAVKSCGRSAAAAVPGTSESTCMRAACTGNARFMQRARLVGRAGFGLVWRVKGGRREMATEWHPGVRTVGRPTAGVDCSILGQRHNVQHARADDGRPVLRACEIQCGIRHSGCRDDGNQHNRRTECDLEESHREGKVGGPLQGNNNYFAEFAVWRQIN